MQITKYKICKGYNGLGETIYKIKVVTLGLFSHYLFIPEEGYYTYGWSHWPSEEHAKQALEEYLGRTKKQKLKEQFTPVECKSCSL